MSLSPSYDYCDHCGKHADECECVHCRECGRWLSVLSVAGYDTDMLCRRCAPLKPGCCPICDEPLAPGKGLCEYHVKRLAAVDAALGISHEPE